MAAAPRPYKDRWGHRHTQAVFEHWHPRTIEFMGVHRARRSPAEVADDKAAEARAQLRDSK